jgi:hypothetical protein
MVVYQGAVPKGFSIQRFRETGRTSKIVKGKEVLYKDYVKKEEDKKKKKPLNWDKRIEILEKKILKKPQAKLPSTDPKKFITKGMGKQSLVKEGRTGYFNEEYMEEKINWLK